MLTLFGNSYGAHNDNIYFPVFIKLNCFSMCTNGSTRRKFWNLILWEIIRDLNCFHIAFTYEQRDLNQNCFLGLKEQRKVWMRRNVHSLHYPR